MKLLNRRKQARIGRYHSTYRKSGLRLGPVALSFVTILIFSLISLFYLAQSNQITTKGYALQKFEQEKAKVQSENERLQVEAARLESLNKISEKSKDLSFVPVKELKYFSSSSGSLAMK